MAVARVKSWAAGEILTAADLNTEFDNVLDNGQSVGSPRTAAFDMDGQELILDSDGDTSITADADDVIDIKIAGSDAVFLGHGTGNTTAYIHVDPTAFTATASTNIGLLRIGNTNAATVPAGTTAIAAGVYIETPNWTATGTITTSATLYIEGAATEGGTDYALWVDAGNAQFDGNVAVTGTTTFTGVTTHGGNVVSDTDSTDDLGTTSVRWANVYTDSIGDSGQALSVAATTFSFNAAATIDTSGNNDLTLNAGTADVIVTTTSTGTVMNIKTSAALSSTVGPLLLVDRDDGGNGSAGNNGGGVAYQHPDDAGNATVYARHFLSVITPTNGSEDGAWTCQVACNGSLVTGLQITGANSSADPNVVVGDSVIGTTATDGFLYIPACAGTPTGVPTAYAGRAALVYDSTNNLLYANDGGGWVAANSP